LLCYRKLEDGTSRWNITAIDKEGEITWISRTRRVDENAPVNPASLARNQFETKIGDVPSGFVVSGSKFDLHSIMFDAVDLSVPLLLLPEGPDYTIPIFDSDDWSRPANIGNRFPESAIRRALKCETPSNYWTLTAYSFISASILLCQTNRSKTDFRPHPAKPCCIFHSFAPEHVAGKTLKISLFY